jgi:hypothetical protein
VKLEEDSCPCCRQSWFTSWKRWCYLDGAEPFVFARNANLGITAAGDDDVFLVNDDVQWTRADCLRDLARNAYSSPDIGILSPQFMGGVGSALQSVRAHLNELTYSEERLCFTGVYIKRSTLTRVGPLDERYDGYGSDDDDYCRRVRAVGLRLAVTPEVVMQHGFGRLNATASFARSMGDVRHSGQEMYRRFEDKWKL